MLDFAPGTIGGHRSRPVAADSFFPWKYAGSFITGSLDPKHVYDRLGTVGKALYDIQKIMLSVVSRFTESITALVSGTGRHGLDTRIGEKEVLVYVQRIVGLGLERRQFPPGNGCQYVRVIEDDFRIEAIAPPPPVRGMSGASLRLLGGARCPVGIAAQDHVRDFFLDARHGRAGGVDPPVPIPLAGPLCPDENHGRPPVLGRQPRPSLPLVRVLIA